VLKRFGVAFAAVVGVVTLASPAWAHIAIVPAEAPKGAEVATLSFQVPNENDQASTTQVELVMPEDKPLAFVKAEAVPGWQVKLDTTKLEQPIESDDGQVTEAVSRVTWSGGKIGPGQFQQFAIEVGPLPDDTDTLLFKALQTYDNGDVVRWIEETPASGEEPEHPAPELTLAAATGDEHGGTTETTAASGNASESSSSDDSDSNGLAIAALIVGAVGLVVGGVALARSGRKPAAS
jgi:uncharacterized protein YcnI